MEGNHETLSKGLREVFSGALSVEYCQGIT